jgi:hypothetical protein
MKPQSPPVWVLLCHDVDGKIYAFEIATTRHGAETARKGWRANDRVGRVYRVVRYVPAPAKRGRKGGKRA